MKKFTFILAIITAITLVLVSCDDSGFRIVDTSADSAPAANTVSGSFSSLSSGSAYAGEGNHPDAVKMAEKWSKVFEMAGNSEAKFSARAEGSVFVIEMKMSLDAYKDVGFAGDLEGFDDITLEAFVYNDLHGIFDDLILSCPGVTAVEVYAKLLNDIDVAHVIIPSEKWKID